MKKTDAALALAMLLCVCLGVHAGGTEKKVRDMTLRFHAVANSDSEYDQKIKLEVRDAVLEVWAKARPENEEDAFKAASALTGEMEKAANERLKRLGAPYGASVKTVREVFPEKCYGDIVLPQGKYDAVRITIGEGKGHNFFCVMFPSVCDGAVSTDELLDYYESGAGPCAAFVINGNKNTVAVRLRILEIIEFLKEKLVK